MTGAGDGNRTRTASLEGWDSTIELHPLVAETSGIVAEVQSCSVGYRDAPVCPAYSADPVIYCDGMSMIVQNGIRVLPPAIRCWTGNDSFKLYPIE